MTLIRYSAAAAQVDAPNPTSRDEIAGRTDHTVEIPNEHTEGYTALAEELGIYIQTGSFLEEDPRWLRKVFNTTCLIGPEGILTRYRKANPGQHTHAEDLDVETTRRTIEEAKERLS